MADNVTLPGAARVIATDQATYSGDTADIQLFRMVETTGAEGSRTVVSPYALVSTLNASTANLGAGATFIGTAEDVSDFSHISVTIFSSHASATDGLQIQQSHDGANWDFGDTFTVPAATGKAFSAPVQARYFRISYTNGGTLTTSFRLGVLFSRQTKKGSSIRAGDARSVENDFDESVAYLAGFNGTSWDRLRSSIAQGLQVDVTRGPAALTGSGSLTAATQAVTLALAGRYANAAFQITGTWVGTITFEASNDGFVNVTTINAARAGEGTISQTATANDIYRVTVAGFTAVRAIMSAYTSGTAVITANASEQTSGVFLNFPLPPGTNNIGTVNQKAADLWVTATGASGAAVTLTLPAPAAGLFHYITGIDLQLYAAAARTGAATPVTVTTTNLPGSPAWHFPTAQAIGAIDRYDVPIIAPIKASAAATATTIVMPVATSGIWRANVNHYTGP